MKLEAISVEDRFGTFFPIFLSAPDLPLTGFFILTYSDHYQVIHYTLKQTGGFLYVF